MAKKIIFLFILILTFIPVFPLFKDKYFSVHDATQPERVFVMAQALKDGQFPVRIVKGLGYGLGYPIYNFYAPLPYYFGGVLNLLGVDLLIATKIMFGFGTLLSFISMYRLGSYWFGRKGGVISAIIYLFAPYHALDVYVRGAVGEYWAYALLPFVFYYFSKIANEENNKKNIAWCAFSIAGVILSHNLTAVMMIPFLALFLLFLLKSSSQKKIFIIKTILTLFLGFAVSSFYFLPMVFEMQYSNVFSQISGNSQYFNHFIDLDQLWDFPWGFGGSAGRNSGISFKIGKLAVLLSFLSFVLVLLNWKKDKKRYISVFLFSTLVISVFMTNKVSEIVWQLIYPFQFFQFPWRFLIFIVFSTSLLSGMTFYYLDNLKYFKNKYLAWIFLVLIVSVTALLNSKYFQPQFYYSENSNFYSNEKHLKTDASKISDEYLPLNFNVFFDKTKVIPISYRYWGNGQVIEKINKSQVKTFEVNFPQDQKMMLYIANFPGWRVYIDGTEVLVDREQLISFMVPKGKHIVEVKFTNTPIRMFGNAFSLFGICIIGVILFSKKYAKNS